MLTMYEPKCEDLWFRRQMLADGETMSYNRAWGGTIPFPEEDWRDWHEHWLVRHEGRRFYRYLINEDGRFVGEIAWHLDGENKAQADVIVHAKYRGRGYGKQGLALLCAAARESGLTELYDDIAADNQAIGMFLKSGFVEESRTELQILLKKIL